LPWLRRPLDFRGGRLVALRKEHEGLRDVPRQARLNEQVHQGFVPAAKADLAAHCISPPFINLAIYICCDSSVQVSRGPEYCTAGFAFGARVRNHLARGNFPSANPGTHKYEFPSVSALGRPSMKMPQRIRGYCPFCNAHRELEVERVKNRPRSELRAGQRRFRRVTAGYGGVPRPEPEGREETTQPIHPGVRCPRGPQAHQRPGGRAEECALRVRGQAY